MKSHDSVAMFRIRRMFSPGPINDRVLSSKAAALDRCWTCELWLYTISLPAASSKACCIPAKMATTESWETQAHPLEPLRNPQRGTPTFLLLSGCLSPAHPRINQYKDGATVLPIPVFFCRAHLEGQAGGNKILQQGAIRYYEVWKRPE